MTRPVPPDTVAVVVTFDSVIPTLGTIATLPPAAPVFACVVVRCVVLAVTVRSRPPFYVPGRLAFGGSSPLPRARAGAVPTPPCPPPPTRALDRPAPRPCGPR